MFIKDPLDDLDRDSLVIVPRIRNALDVSSSLESELFLVAVRLQTLGLFDEFISLEQGVVGLGVLLGLQLPDTRVKACIGLGNDRGIQLTLRHITPVHHLSFGLYQ